MSRNEDLYALIKGYVDAKENDGDDEIKDIYKATNIDVEPTRIVFKDSKGNELYSIDAIEIGKDKLVEKTEGFVFKEAAEDVGDMAGKITDVIDAAQAIDNMIKYKDPWDIDMNDLASVVAPIAGPGLGLYVGGVCYIGNECLQKGKTLIATHYSELLGVMMTCDGYVSDESKKELEKYADILGITPGELAIMLYQKGLLEKDLLMEILNDYADSAENARERRVDPIVIDLNGNGVTKKSIHEGVNFDFNNDGFAEKTEWIEKEDGFLVRDLNGNGTIDNVSELFGDHQLLSNGQLSETGLDVLKDLDTNKDGYIDSKDAVFSKLAIWRDLNSNGITDAGELISLSKLNITRLKLYDSVASDDGVGKVIMKNGTEKKMLDLFFNINNIDSKDNHAKIEDLTNDTELINTLKALPQVFGTGVAGNLRKAMLNDEELRTMVKNYIDNPGLSSLNSINDILFKWCNADKIDPSSRGTNIDARKLAVVEMFLGNKFEGTNGSDPNNEAAIILVELFDRIKKYATTQMATQSYLAPYIDSIRVRYNGRTEEFYYDLNTLKENVLKINNFDKAAVILKQLAVLYSSDELLLPTLNDLISELRSSYGEFDFYYGIDNLSESGKASSASDILSFEGRNKKISGGASNDLYVFKKGTGNTVINNYYNHGDAKNADNDMLSMEDVKYSDCQLIMNGNDLIIKVYGTTDTVTISDCFESEYNRINEIKFADKVMSYDDIVNYFKTVGTKMNGTSDDDNLSLNALSWAKATINGGTGNDTLRGGDSQDTIYGGKGNDTIYGNAGNDTLIGEAGNDLLVGNAGNDTYIFMKGYGQDTIDNYYSHGVSSNADNDILNMKNLKFDECELSMEGTNLIVKIKGTTDKVTIKNCFESEYYRINKIKFTDKTMTYNDIVKYFTEIGSNITGTTDDDTLNVDALSWSKVTANGGEGNDRINGGNSQDTIYGGRGNDTIYGYSGNDTLIGEAGYDYLNGGSGNDTYIFKKGYGQDVIDNYYNHGESKNADNDILKMQGLKFSDCQLVMDGSNLVIKVKGTTDKVTIKNCFESEYYKIDSINFDDKTMTYDDLVKYFTEVGTNITGTSKDDTINVDALSWAKTVLKGGSGNDTIKGGNSKDTIYGGNGNDTIYGYAGNDTLVGEAGKDTLIGGAGNDTYVFKKGYGQDVIDNYYNHGSAENADMDILFMQGIKYSDCELVMSGNDLIIKVNGTTDKVTIKRCFESEYYNIDKIRFADKVLTYNDIVKYFTTVGTKITGTDEDDNLEVDALAWSKTTVEGGYGNDTLRGGNSSDTLIGGAGKDTLIGGAGNDTYVFKKGYGQDTIDNYYDHRYGKEADNDTLLMQELKYSDCELIMDGSNLVVKIKGTNDKITIKNCFDSEYYRINQIKFVDKTMSYDDIVKYFTEVGTKITGTDDDDTINMNGLSWAKSKLVGGAGNDEIRGGDSRDTIYGGDGNDSIYGNAGNDTLIGEEGDDLLVGGSGNDTYIFMKGYGQDTINNFYDHGNAVNADTDTIYMQDIKYSECELVMQGNNLIIKVKGTEDQVTVSNCFSSEYYRIDRIKFADRNMTYNDLVKYFELVGTKITGTDEDDTINVNALSWSKTTVNGGYGNDRIDGSYSADTIYGGLGNDTIYGNSSDDILIGEEGRDYLNGGAGNDTYVFKKGYGQDTIDNYYGHGDATNADNDILYMQGLKYSDCSLMMNGNDLIIGIKGTNERVTVSNCFSSEYYRINEVKFADKIMTYDDIVKYFTEVGTKVVGSDEDDTLNLNALSWSKGTLSGGVGNDTLRGGNSQDTLYGGIGNDALYGNDGNDVLMGQEGRDYLNGGAGNDTYIFKKGYGQDTIDNYYYHGDAKYADTDTLYMQGLRYSDCELAMQGSDLVVKVKGTDDKITVSNCFNSEYYRIDKVQFADRVMTYDDIVKYFTTTGTKITGTIDNDTIDINALDWSKTTVYAGDGDDRINGANSQDTIYGEEGNDVIYGYNGNDILTGGLGNDTLNGGAGNDTYVYKKGDGQDIIDNYCYHGDASNADSDTLELKDLKASDITLTKNGNDLVVSINGTDDKITISNQYYGEYYRINNIKFSDNTTISCDENGEFSMEKAIGMIKQTYCSTSMQGSVIMTNSHEIKAQTDMVNLFVK